jgi:hypothetical protein
MNDARSHERQKKKVVDFRVWDLFVVSVLPLVEYIMRVWKGLDYFCLDQNRGRRHACVKNVLVSMKCGEFLYSRGRRIPLYEFS